MARPKKEGLDYFPHDTDAVNDEKIEALRMLYGNDGYAFYFILLERIYRTKHAELDVSDAETIQILSKKVGISAETFHRILETCFKRDCFDREAYEERGVLTSYGIKKRVAPVVEKREKMRQKYVSDKEGVSESETEQKPDKVKESKGKKSKEEIPYGEIISYLNEKTGKNFKPSTTKTKESIKARWNEGFVVEDFKRVIEIKSSEWLKGDMEKYLRPDTLFGTKFEGYLNQVPKQEPKDNLIHFEDRRKNRAEELKEAISLGKDYWKMTDDEEAYYRMQEELKEIEQQL